MVYILWLLVFAAFSKAEETFSEELLLKPMESGHLLSHFRFVHILSGPSLDYRNFRTFPRPFWEVIQLHQVRELHFALTQGHWKTKSWGYPPRSAPAGAEIYAWFTPEVTDVDNRWQLLTNGLSGLFCSSLNFVNAANTITPAFSYGLEGVAHPGLNSSHVRYAALPSEIVCTENLTPWKKLLSCDTKRGLASLLNPKSVFDSNYHSLAVDLRPICSDPDCLEMSWELVLSLTMVTEPPVMNSASLGKQDWSLRTTFGSGLFSHCPLARTSKIYVDISENEMAPRFQLIPETTVVSSNRGGNRVRLAVYDIKQFTEDSALNIRAIYNKPIVYGVIPPPALYASRSVAGIGNEKGTIVTRITNSRASEAIRVVYMEILPWYLRVLGHSLKVIANSNKALKPDHIHFVPGRDRVRPHHLEVVLEIPAYSTVEIQFNFEKAFLKWHEYPPDANHGFDVPSAVVSAFLPVARNYTALPQDRSTFESSMNVSSSRGYLVRIHTETLVVTVATPDFSMPYNVICLTCTVVALAFGPLHNYTTKRFVKRLPKKNKIKKFVGALKSKIKALPQRFRSRKAVEKAVSVPSSKPLQCEADSREVVS